MLHVRARKRFLERKKGILRKLQQKPKLVKTGQMGMQDFHSDDETEDGDEVDWSAHVAFFTASNTAGSSSVAKRA